MPLPLSKDPGDTIRALNSEHPSMPQRQKVAIGLSQARKAGAHISPASGEGGKESPFYKNRPQVQDGPTTMDFLETSSDDQPSQVKNLDRTNFGKYDPPRSSKPFSKGTADNLSDKPPFMKED